MKEKRFKTGIFVMVLFSFLCVISGIAALMCLFCVITGSHFLVFNVQIGGDTRWGSFGESWVFDSAGIIFGILAFYLPAKINKAL